MTKLSLLVVLGCLAVALSESRIPQHGLIHQIQKGVAGPNPYIFLTVPKGRSQTLVRGFEVIEENENKTDNKKPIDEDEDEEDADNDDDDDDQQIDNDDDDEIKDSLEKENEDAEDEEDSDDDDDNDDDDLDNVMSMNLKFRKSHPQFKEAKATQMMVSREHAGAIMVPDEIIEIEGQSVIDEKTGKPALLLPRNILDSIPDGSVVALMELSTEDGAEARANRVIVRRRRKGVRRNIKRRSGSNKRPVVNRRVVYRIDTNRRGVNRRGVNRRIVNKRGGNKRRRNKKPQNVRRRNNRRRGNQRPVNRRRVSAYA